jgi:hypothetical protein
MEVRVPPVTINHLTLFGEIHLAVMNRVGGRFELANWVGRFFEIPTSLNVAKSLLVEKIAREGEGAVITGGPSTKLDRPLILHSRDS